MANTVVHSLGGTKDTIINRKTVCYSPKGERIVPKVGTIPKDKY